MMGLIRWVLLLNGMIDVAVGVGLTLFPVQIALLLGYPELPGYAAFSTGGWGIAALTFGAGRIIASGDENKYRLWVLLGLLEGSILTVFCLKYWLGNVVSFMQVCVPLFVAVIFGLLYLVAFPTILRRKA